jgi:hypothetical protein
VFVWLHVCLGTGAAGGEPHWEARCLFIKGVPPNEISHREAQLKELYYGVHWYPCVLLNPIAHGSGGKFFPPNGIYCKCSKTDELFSLNFHDFSSFFVLSPKPKKLGPSTPIGSTVWA